MKTYVVDFFFFFSFAVLPCMLLCYEGFLFYHRSYSMNKTQLDWKKYKTLDVYVEIIDYIIIECV